MSDSWHGPLWLIAESVNSLLADWLLVLVLVVLVSGMMGRIGKGVGLFHLFRDDDELFDGIESKFAREVSLTGIHRFTASPAFWSGLGLAITAGLVWMVMHTGAPRVGSGSLQLLGPEGEIRSAGLVALGIALLGSVGLSVWIAVRYMRLPRSDLKEWPPDRRKAEIGRATAGGLVGAVAVVLVCALALGLAQVASDPIWLSRLFGAAGNWPVLPFAAIALPYLIFVAAVFSRRNSLSCVSIFCLVILLVLIFGLVGRLAGVIGEFAVALAIIWVWMVNGRPGKYRLPGFDYDSREEPLSEDAGRHGNMLDPLEALVAWKNRVAPEKGQKPILVLVATSGGAYRATFWTSLILDRLIASSGVGGRWPGLDQNIRLVTGASGGMVAGAYLVAMAAEGKLSDELTHRIIADTRKTLEKDCRRRYPIGRDSLSPLIHQMMRRDLWHPMRPGQPKSDRGRVLESQWRSLDKNFDALRKAEAEGRAPSIIVSPMLVETGAVALFSNLDLEAIRKRAAPPGKEMAASVEIFRTFAGTQDNVTLATAVRLSATFPYLSPAISLPTTTDRRVVDAGYYDNYGIDLATGFLEERAIQTWIKENCAGVAVIEIRAFPAQRLVSAPTSFARAIQFLTSPFEGLMSARQASQIFRNTQQLYAARERIAEATGDPDFLKILTFEAARNVSMSWYLRLDEIEALDEMLNPLGTEDEAWLCDYMKHRREDDLMPALRHAGEDGKNARRAWCLIQRRKIALTFGELEAWWNRKH